LAQRSLHTIFTSLTTTVLASLPGEIVTRTVRYGLLVTALSLLPASSQAQSLAGKVAELIRFGNCAQALCLVTGPGEHQTHYIGAAQTASADLVSFLTNSISASVGRLPISATSSGTTFSFVDGAPVQNTTSAGPIFAERGTTLGKGRWLVGANTTRLSFSQLRGVDTKELDINLAHQDVGTSGLGDSPFELDIIGMNIDLGLTLQASTVFATYGLTDRIDVSVAVPFVQSSLDASAIGTISNLSGSVTGAHYFGTAESQSLTANSNVNGSAAGVGDIAARVKANLLNSSDRALAVLGEARLPTGDEESFHGAGSTTINALLIGSARYGAFSPHANLGFSVRSGEGQTNAMLATVGFDQLLSPAVTLAIDLLSEFQAGTSDARLPQTITYVSPARTVRGTNIPDTKDNPIALSLGGRFLLGGYTVVANGLLPVKTGGLQASLAWTLGLERSF
jgi:hypothetical protein